MIVDVQPGTLLGYFHAQKSLCVFNVKCLLLSSLDQNCNVLTEHNRAPPHTFFMKIHSLVFSLLHVTDRYGKPNR